MKLKRGKGFVLIATGVCIVSLFGMLGLAIDLGRVYIAKNETQSYTDTAALAGTLKLNGVSFTPVRAAVTGNTKNQWNLGTTIFTASGGSTTITTEFARPLATNLSKPDPATWEATPLTADGYTFLRVTATATLPLYILPVIGTNMSQGVRTATVGGQVPIYSFTSGLLPFSPIFHSDTATPANPTGFTVGNWYTLRYPGGATFTNSDLCSGDQGNPTFLALANTQVSDERGFYQDPAASIARDEIINGEMIYPVIYPGTVTMYGGAMSTAQDALNDRIRFDTDQVSNTYEQYQANVDLNGDRIGNGFRLVGTPVNAGPVAGGGPRNLVAFGGFFLSAGPNGSVFYNGGGGQPWCAEYYGVWVKGAQQAGAGKPGLAYVTQMVQ
jgi:hypothetical protein